MMLVFRSGFWSGRRRKVVSREDRRDLLGLGEASFLLDLFADVEAVQNVRNAIAGAKSAGAHLQHALLVAVPGVVIVFFMPGVGLVFSLDLRAGIPKAGALGVIDGKLALDHFPIVAARDFAPGDAGIAVAFDPLPDLMAGAPDHRRDEVAPDRAAATDDGDLLNGLHGRNAKFKALQHGHGGLSERFLFAFCLKEPGLNGRLCKAHSLIKIGWDDGANSSARDQPRKGRSAV